MATAEGTLTPINTNATTFRAWGKGLSDLMKSVGLVQTEDTGQIDWNTVNAPGSSTTFMGYEIFRSDDGDDVSLFNWYMKIEYGSADIAARPALRITTGWGSDGAGTLTTNAKQYLELRTTYTSAGPAKVCMIDGNLAVSLIEQSALIFFMIERSRNLDQSPKNEIAALGMATGGNIGHYVSPRTGNNTNHSQSNSEGWRVPSSSNNTDQYNSSNGIGTFAPMKGGYLQESITILGGNTTRYPTSGSSFIANMFGVNRTYLSLNSTFSAVVASRLLMRWE